MRVRVTQDHIANGRKRQPKCCPIALAIPVSCAVRRNRVEFLDDQGEVDAVIMLPQEAINFINAFDQDLPVEPMEFEL
jgi:hypothetical protein